MSNLNPDETLRLLRRSVSALQAAADALPLGDELVEEGKCIEQASRRGYFFPDEDELVRLRYNQYLALRSAMGEVLEDLKFHAGHALIEWHRWRDRLPLFATAFAASCILDRADRHLIGLASGRPVVWKKLDEEDRAGGVPRKTFTRIYREHSRPRRRTRLVLAVEFYRRHGDQILALESDPALGPVLGPVLALLRSEEPWMDGRVRRAVRHRAAYRWFSLLRRHRSAWKRVMFGMFEASGRAVAELKVPGVKSRGQPKRIDAAMRGELEQLLQAGDVVVTRHDDALSNWFLPGYWPHAALFLGATDDAHGESGGPCFLEAKKDGVRIRESVETLAVDALLVLRPPLGPEAVARALRRALDHAGKGYDFVFDFRTADRLACTELVYRAYHGLGPVAFELREISGRRCLPAEELLGQAIACGFELVATAGLAGERVLVGEAARQAFEPTRP